MPYINFLSGLLPRCFHSIYSVAGLNFIMSFGILCSKHLCCLLLYQSNAENLCSYFRSSVTILCSSASTSAARCLSFCFNCKTPLFSKASFSGFRSNASLVISSTKFYSFIHYLHYHHLQVSNAYNRSLVYNRCTSEGVGRTGLKINLICDNEVINIC